MKLYWVLGFAVGIAVVAVVGIIAAKKQNKAGKATADYDERQVAARGKCFQSAFFTTFFMDVVMALLAVLFEDSPLLQGPMPYLLMFFLGATVFAVAAIRNDAYLRPSESSTGYTFLFGALGILNLIGGIRHIMDGSMLDEAGRMDTGCLNLGAGLFLLIVTAAILIKKAQDKKAATLENDAE